VYIFLPRSIQDNSKVVVIACKPIQDRDFLKELKEARANGRIGADWLRMFNHHAVTNLLAPVQLTIDIETETSLSLRTNDLRTITSDIDTRTRMN